MASSLGENVPTTNEGEEEENEDDGDGSTFEDLDEPLPIPAKKAGIAKSSAKSVPTTDKWTADIDGACQNRYGLDRPEMVE